MIKFLINIVYLSVFIALAALSGCVKTPVDNSPISNTKAESGDVLVLAEGLQGYDNSSLTLIKSQSGEIIPDYFKSSNPDQFLGDTANDMILKGDTAIVVLSTPSIIRLIRVSTGKLMKDIKLFDEFYPRSIAFLNDSTIAVSLLFRSSVMIMNINNSSIISEIPVGPQPEGVAYFEGMIYSANSAYGDFNYMHKDATTFSVITSNNYLEISKIKSGPNCSEILVNPKNRELYAVFYNLPSKEDEPGGIVEYDLNDYHEIRRWNIRARSVRLSTTMDSLFFISQMHKGSSMSEQSGISCIDLKSGNTELIITNPNKFDIWYNMSVSPFDGSIWICNARNHINNGEILVYQNPNYTAPKIKFNVLLNPNKVVFIR